MIKTKENYIFIERYAWIRRIFVLVSLSVLVGVPLYYREKMTINSISGWGIFFVLYYVILYFRFVRRLNREKEILQNGIRTRLKIVEYDERIHGKHIAYYPVFHKEGYKERICGVNEVPYLKREIGAIEDLIFYQNECVVIDNSNWKELK